MMNHFKKQINSLPTKGEITSLFVNRWGPFIHKKQYFGISDISTNLTEAFWQQHHYSRNLAIQFRFYLEFNAPNDIEITKMLIGKDGCYSNMTTQNFRLVGIFVNPFNKKIEIFGPQQNARLAANFMIQRITKLIEQKHTKIIQQQEKQNLKHLLQQEKLQEIENIQQIINIQKYQTLKNYNNNNNNNKQTLKQVFENKNKIQQKKQQKNKNKNQNRMEEWNNLDSDNWEEKIEELIQKELDIK